MAETEIDCIEDNDKIKNKQTDRVKATLLDSFYLYHASGERTRLKLKIKFRKNQTVIKLEQIRFT
jgi:hypothetical protein